jgi:hypothetical protein
MSRQLSTPGARLDKAENTWGSTDLIPKFFDFVLILF